MPARSRQHAGHRPHRRHDAPHLAHQPAADARRPRCPAHLAAEQAASMTSDDGDVRPDAAWCSRTSSAWASTTWCPSAATTRSASRRRSHDHGVPLIAIPKTMDNDVQGTEYCIGFSTAITRAKELINRQRTTLGSHERIGVFRIFGRDCGFTALYTAYVTSARCLIPEAPFDLDHLVRDPRRGQAAQPQPLRVRHRRRGRHLGGRRDRTRSARPTRSATATRPTWPRSWPTRSGRGRASRRCSPS